jgi:hypothetical protein
MGLWHKFVDHAVSEITVVKKAPLSFGAALVVGWALVAVAIWFALDWRYSGIIANKDSLIATLQGQQSAKPNEARDPDTIYQYGHPVGKVVAPEAHLAEGYWTFSRIMADGTFDGSRDFEYRNQRLKILSAESAGRIGSMGQIKQQNFANVRATVLGHR